MVVFSEQKWELADRYFPIASGLNRLVYDYNATIPLTLLWGGRCGGPLGVCDNFHLTIFKVVETNYCSKAKSTTSKQLRLHV